MMKNPWLIQRCRLRRSPSAEITGFDSVFSCDYMGSAEFEFGALPQSLRRVVGQNWSIHETATKAQDGRALFIVSCADSQRKQIAKLLPDLVANKVRLKESTRLADALNDHEYARDFVLWWDIQNDWFLCLGRDVADLLIRAIDALREKWKSQ